jgi:2-phospho-L-lactate guanylyltransferase
MKRVNAVVPFKTKGAKKRLAPFLSPEERREFSMAMLRDVLKSLKDTHVTILATEEFTLDTSETMYTSGTMNASGTTGITNATIQINHQDLNEALNEFIADLHEPTLIVMSDIPLMRSWHVKWLVSGGVTLVPGRGGGTNAIYMHDPSTYRVDFYEVSFLKHVKIAKERGLPLKILDSFYMSTDIDKPEDLAEVLIHCPGESCKYLKSLGVRLSYGKSRIGVERD